MARTKQTARCSSGGLKKATLGDIVHHNKGERGKEEITSKLKSVPNASTSYTHVVTAGPAQETNGTKYIQVMLPITEIFHSNKTDMMVKEHSYFNQKGAHHHKTDQEVRGIDYECTSSETDSEDSCELDIDDYKENNNENEPPNKWRIIDDSFRRRLFQSNLPTVKGVRCPVTRPNRDSEEKKDTLEPQVTASTCNSLPDAISAIPQNKKMDEDKGIKRKMPEQEDKYDALMDANIEYLNLKKIKLQKDIEISSLKQQKLQLEIQILKKNL